MADYVIVPYSNYTDAANLYTDGVTILRSTDTTYGGIWRITSRTQATTIRAGLHGYSIMVVGTDVDIVYTITWLPANSDTASIYGSYTANSIDGQWHFGSTYFPIMSAGNYTTDLTIYSNSQECLDALTGEPIVNPGVHVTFSPVYIPSFPGVHVTFNPVLTNPYAPGGDAQPGGGGGQFDNPTDPIQLPDLPTHGVTDFIKLWNPSNADMVRLTELLFTGNIFTQAIRDLIGQPIDYIVSLGIVPVPLSIGSVSVPFKLAHQDAGFNMYGVTQQYMRWSCGSVLVPLYWNSFLDFEPHTSIQLYLPFIGFRDVLPSDVVGKTITITYHIDAFTGACVAYIANEDTILYQYNGSCLAPIPFGAEQMQNLVSSVLGVLGSAATAGAVAAGGFSAAIGRVMTAGAIAGAASSVVNSFKHNTQHGGNAGSSVGLLSSRKPYFILNRPRQAVASAQGTYSGFATWYTVESFGQLDGYTQVAECHLHDIPATDWELQEIERLLKEGVIF